MKSTDIKIINQKILYQAKKMRGYLQKQSNNIFVGFQKRFFLIIQDNLVYFIDQTLDQPKGYIQIINIKNLKSTGNSQFSFKHQDRIYYLRSDCTQIRDEWVASLKLIIYELKHNEKNVNVTQVQAKWKKNDIQKKLKSLVDIQIENKKSQNYQLLNIQPWSQSIFKKLCLMKLYEGFGEQKIKNRLLIKKFREGIYLLISCKSLNKNYEDEEILNKNYIQPYDFNILYQYDNQKNILKEILKTTKIYTIEIIEEKYLKINNLLLTCEQNIIDFVDNVKTAIKIGQQYHNQLKIPLRKNIQLILKIYQECKNQNQKWEKLKIKFEDQYLKIISKYEKHYRNVFNAFQSLLEQLFEDIKSFVGAFRLKNYFQDEIVIFYIKFMHNKIINELKLYWDNNYPVLLDEQILTLASWLYQYNQIVNFFIKNNKIKKEIKVLNKVYFRNIYQTFTVMLNEKLKDQKSFQISIAYTSKLPFQFSCIIEKVIKTILKTYYVEESTKKIQQYVIRCYKILYEKILEFIKRQNRINILVALCNDIWLYKKEIQNLKQIDFNEINKINNKMHNQLTKKIIKVIITSYQRLNSQPFLNIEVNDFCLQLLKNVENLENLHAATITLIKIKSLEEFIGCYFRILANNIQSQQFLCETILMKLQIDNHKIKKIYTEQLQSSILQNISQSFLLIKQILKEDDSNKLKQYFISLKTNFLYDFISYHQICRLLKLRYLSEPKRTKILNICKQVFQNQTYKNYNDQQFIMVEKNKESNNPLTRKTTLTISFAHKSWQNSVCEGYLETKVMKPDYQKRFFKVQDGNINCYLSPSSIEILFTIKIKEINNVHQNQRHTTKFMIELENGEIYKFIAATNKSCQHWIQEISKVKKNIVFNELKDNEEIQQNQNPIFIDYLFLNKMNILEGRSSIHIGNNESQSQYKIKKSGTHSPGKSSIASTQKIYFSRQKQVI